MGDIEDLRSPKSERAKPAEDVPVHLEYLSRVSGIGVIPAGELFLAPHTFDSKRTAAWLVLNLDQPSAKGERSYAIYVTAECATHRLTLWSWITYDNSDWSGRRVRSETPSEPDTFDASDAGLASALGNFCSRAAASNQ